MECSVYGGSSIDESKTGYENCQEKGYDDFCLMKRISSERWYSGTNCNDGFEYENTQSGTLACTNMPESGFNCNTPLEILNGVEQRSKSENSRDEVICCKSQQPVDMECLVYGGSSIDESITGYENCEEKGYDDFCLMNRIGSRRWYSGTNCNDGFEYENTQSGTLACVNKPESEDYSYCNTPLAIQNGVEKKSIYNDVRDEVICCKAQQPINMECSVYGGSSIDKSKTGYENCEEKGYDDFCLMNRISSERWYSGTNCNSGFEYENTQSGTLACTNIPESGPNCNTPLEILDGVEQRSIRNDVRDEVICCKSTVDLEPVDIVDPIYQGSCTDSDNGEYYSVQGELKITNQDGEVFTYEDKCSGNTLTEYTCKQATIDLSSCSEGCNLDVEYTCSEGCQNGVCLTTGGYSDSHLLVVDDNSPPTDVILLTDIGLYLNNLDFEMGVAKVNSEITKSLLEGRVTTFVYEGNVAIIIGSSSPSEHLFLAEIISEYLEEQKGINALTLFSLDVKYHDLKKIFVEEVPSSSDNILTDEEDMAQVENDPQQPDYCSSDSDCTTGYCDTNTGLCKTFYCSNGVKDDDEEDIDCGGSCPESCIIDECSQNMDCDDEDGCTDDICSDSPKVCSNKKIIEGCSWNDVCIPIGIRIEEKYCDLDKSLKEQKSKKLECNNHYECSSSVCLDNKCISPSFIQNIIDWFKKLFGG